MTVARALLVCVLAIGCGPRSEEELPATYDAGSEPSMSREALEHELDRIEQEITGDSQDAEPPQEH
jgi:hypothetical protein